MISIEYRNYSQDLLKGLTKLKDRTNEHHQEIIKTNDQVTLKHDEDLGKYICSFCHMNFKRKDRLDGHLFKHTGIKSFICNFDDCKKSYTNLSHLTRHKRTFHESKPKINDVVCIHPECFQGFTNSNNMNRHYKNVHLNKNPHKCSSCAMGFHRKFQLKKHLKTIHDIGSYTYECENCDSGFFNQALYKRHLIQHKPSKKKCSGCNQIFSKWSLLVKHRRECSYSNFTCDLCPKSFFRKPNLRQHMNIHMLEELVYQCHYEDCPKFYNAKRNLMNHIQSKHEGKKFICPKCQCKLSSKQKLNQHISAHEDPNKAKYIKKSIISVLTNQ